MRFYKKTSPQFSVDLPALIDVALCFGWIDVKGQICRDSRAKDSNVRQALIDRYGGPSTVKKGGVLHGVSKDVWAALAVGVTYWETRNLRNLT